MATKKSNTTPTKKTTSKTKAITKDVIVSAYMEYVLMNEKTPKSVYKFAKEHAMTEAKFYKFFGSFENLQQGIWTAFFDNAMKLGAKKLLSMQTSTIKKKCLLFSSPSLNC